MRDSQNVEPFPMTHSSGLKEHGKEKSKEFLLFIIYIHFEIIIHSTNIDYSGPGTVIGAWGSAYTILLIKTKIKYKH